MGEGSCGALVRGLQNLDASFIKGFNCCGAKMSLLCADSRFGEPRSSLRGSTGCHFLHRAKSNQKARGTPSCDLDSTLCRNLFGRNLRRHVPKPVLPVKRRRKGFESVRKGSCIADARLMFFRKRNVVLQAHSSKRYSKRVAAR